MTTGPSRPRTRRSATGRRASASASRKPSLRLERILQREGHRLVAGMDEVGRGALAGPVSVGVVVVDPECRSAPVGIRDSKLLPPHRREALVGPVRRWALAWGVGHAGPDEIDAVGIMGALRLAGRRALDAAGLRPDLVVLDGNHDWFTDPAREGLLAFAGGDHEFAGGDHDRAGGDHEFSRPAEGAPAAPSRSTADPWAGLPVHTVIKGDLTCSSVAAASILAKVERDARMVGHASEFPAYGWEVNKGYAAPGHREALLAHGACVLHRRTWNLLAAPLGVGPADAEDDGP